MNLSPLTLPHDRRRRSIEVPDLDRHFSVEPDVKISAPLPPPAMMLEMLDALESGDKVRFTLPFQEGDSTPHVITFIGRVMGVETRNHPRWSSARVAVGIRVLEVESTQLAEA